MPGQTLSSSARFVAAATLLATAVAVPVKCSLMRQSHLVVDITAAATNHSMVFVAIDNPDPDPHMILKPGEETSFSMSVYGAAPK